MMWDFESEVKWASGNCFISFVSLTDHWMPQSQTLFGYCRLSKQSLFYVRIKFNTWKQSWEKCVSLGCQRNWGMCEGCPKSIVALSVIKSVSRGNICVFLWLILNVPLAIVAARNIAFSRGCAEGCQKWHDVLPWVLNNGPVQNFLWQRRIQ
jgi:hypothetical protein